MTLMPELRERSAWCSHRRGGQLFPPPSRSLELSEAMERDAGVMAAGDEGGCPASAR